MRWLLNFWRGLLHILVRCYTDYYPLQTNFSKVSALISAVLYRLVVRWLLNFWRGLLNLLVRCYTDYYPLHTNFSKVSALISAVLYRLLVRWLLRNLSAAEKTREKDVNTAIERADEWMQQQQGLFILFSFVYEKRPYTYAKRRICMMMTKRKEKKDVNTAIERADEWMQQQQGLFTLFSFFFFFLHHHHIYTSLFICVGSLFIHICMSLFICVGLFSYV